jgi:hypothetical protein
MRSYSDGSSWESFLILFVFVFPCWNYGLPNCLIHSAAVFIILGYNFSISHVRFHLCSGTVPQFIVCMARIIS